MITGVINRTPLPASVRGVLFICLSDQCELADDGEGISPEDLPHIWELFYRGDKSRSSKGTGLGLALVKQIVEFHKGRISVESELGKGSTFKITL